MPSAGDGITTAILWPDQGLNSSQQYLALGKPHVPVGHTISNLRPPLETKSSISDPAQALKSISFMKLLREVQPSPNFLKLVKKLGLGNQTSYGIFIP